MKSVEEIMLVEALLKTTILLSFMLIVCIIAGRINDNKKRKLNIKKSLLKKQALEEIKKARLKKEHKELFAIIKEF